MRHESGAARCTPLPHFTSVASSRRWKSAFAPRTRNTRRGAAVRTARAAHRSRVQGERGLRHRVEAQVERVHREAEADHGPPEDPGHVRQQAAQVDPARVEPAPEPVARGSLRGEVDEGVRHSLDPTSGGAPVLRPTRFSSMLRGMLPATWSEAATRQRRRSPRSRRDDRIPRTREPRRPHASPGSVRDSRHGRRPARCRPDPALRVVPGPVARASLRVGATRSTRTGTPSSSSATPSPRAGAEAWARRFPASRSPTAASAATPRAASCCGSRRTCSPSTRRPSCCSSARTTSRKAPRPRSSRATCASSSPASSSTTRACRSSCARCSPARRR